MDWGKRRKTSVRRVNVPAGIRTENFMNMNLKCRPYDNTPDARSNASVLYSNKFCARLSFGGEFTTKIQNNTPVKIKHNNLLLTTVIVRRSTAASDLFSFIRIFLNIFQANLDPICWKACKLARLYKLRPLCTRNIVPIAHSCITALRTVFSEYRCYSKTVLRERVDETKDACAAIKAERINRGTNTDDGRR
jgi:hypothetical protein